MSDIETLLLVESKKKSGAIAALLNLVFPGAGYVYCGNWVLGIIAFLLVVSLAAVTMGVALIGLTPMLVVDGFLAAARHNKKMIESVIKEKADIKRQVSDAAN